MDVDRSVPQGAHYSAGEINWEKNEESKGLMILSSPGGSCTIVLPVEHALVLPALIVAICKEIGIYSSKSLLHLGPHQIYPRSSVFFSI